MITLRSIYNFLFEVPALPEPFTRNPAILSENLREILGMVGLANHEDRITAGNVINTPIRYNEDGILPHMQIEVGRRDRLVRISMRHLDTDAEIHIHIRQNPETEEFYFDKIDNKTPHQRISQLVTFEDDQTDPTDLRKMLDVIRLAVSRMNQGVLENLNITSADINQLSANGFGVGRPAPSY